MMPIQRRKSSVMANSMGQNATNSIVGDESDIAVDAKEGGEDEVKAQGREPRND